MSNTNNTEALKFLDHKVEDVLHRYWGWCRGSFKITKIDDGTYEITVPYLDRCNDWFQIYCTITENGEIVLSDDGFIFGNSRLTTDRAEKIKRVLKRFGVDRQGRALIKSVEYDIPMSLPVSLHSYIQALISVDAILM